MSDELKVEHHNDVVWITLNRPGARNALSMSLNRELAARAAELRADSRVRAVVLTGAGDKVFCAGADLKERKGVSAAETGPYVDAISGAINAIAAIRAPTICALSGSAFGGGLELALACDFRVAVTGSVFALTEVRLGIMPGAGGTQRLTRLLGVARAKELILFGKRVTAEEAAAIGLVNAVVAPADLGVTVAGMLSELAECAPISVASAKEAIERGHDVSLAEGLAIERACYEVTLFTEDRNEGLAAFAEKRPPRYLGK